MGSVCDLCHVAPNRIAQDGKCVMSDLDKYVGRRLMKMVTYKWDDLVWDCGHRSILRHGVNLQIIVCYFLFMILKLQDSALLPGEALPAMI